jgi:hypothetical protein
MTPQDRSLLTLGAVLAALGLGCMLLLFPLLEVTGNAWTVLAAMLGLAGVGLATFALRARLLVVGPAAALVAGLAIVVGVLRWESPKAPGELTNELVVKMGEMASLGESIRDEATLQSARSNLVTLFSRILKLHRMLSEQEAAGKPLEPEKGQAIDKAIEEFEVRMVGVAGRLPDVSGGADLARRLAQLAPPQQPTETEKPPGKRRSTQSGGSASSEANRQRLGTLDICLHRYVGMRKKAPESWEAMENFLQDAPNELAAVRQLRAEGFVVHWGVTPDQTVGVRHFVLAYEKDAPQQGGLMLVITFASGEYHEVEAEEIRQMLNEQAPFVQKVTGVAPPTWPTKTAEPDQKRASLTAWIPWGWLGPANPPEPPQNRDRRAQAMEKAGRNSKTALIYLQGVATWKTAREVQGLIMEANGGIGPLEFHDRDDGKSPWEFTCGNVEDIRRLAFMLDIGPVTGIDEAAGIIRARLDVSRVRERSRAKERRSQGLASRPLPAGAVAGATEPGRSIPGTASAQDSPGKKLAAATVPPPPEPPENIQRRSQARRSAGLGSMARGRGTSQPPGPLSVEIGVQGVLEGAEKPISNRLLAIGGGTIGWTVMGSGLFVFQLSEVQDIRVLAAKIDFGTIITYDEEQARIAVRADPAKMAEMAKAPSPTEPNLAAAPPNASSSPASGPDKQSGQPSGTTMAGSPQPGSGPTTDPRVPPPFRPGFGPRGPAGGPAGPGMGSGAPGFGPGAGSGVPGFSSWTGPGMGAGATTKPGQGRKTELVGGLTGGSWEATSNSLPVLGFSCLFEASAEQKGFSRFEPVFFRARAPKDAVLAREGYAVGGLMVDADQHVQAVQVIFMRIGTDGKLDPADKYTSEWIGQRTGRPPRMIGGDGAKVTGAHSRRGPVLNAIGLILE